MNNKHAKAGVNNMISNDYNSKEIEEEIKEEEEQQSTAAAALFNMMQGVGTTLSSSDGEDLEQHQHNQHNQPLKKRHKTNHDVDDETIHQGSNRKNVSASPKEQRTGICQKLAAINKEIKEKEEAITATKKEITRKQSAIQEKEGQLGETPTTDYSQDPVVPNALMREKDARTALWREKFALWREKDALWREKDALWRDKDALKDQKDALKDMFTRGKYYAATADYLEIVETSVIPDDAKWESFVRGMNKDEASTFQCRDVNTTCLQVSDPYDLTREGATSAGNVVANSDTTSNESEQSKSKSSKKDRLWSTDIFGDKPTMYQDIAPIMPAGRDKAHKQWLNVAAAALGIQPTGISLEGKKKAARGFKAQEDERRKPKSGVIHFVSNKIRLAGQRYWFGGTTPAVLIIPVMSLQEAKDWRGQDYQAICLGGYPRHSCLGCIDADKVYTSIRLHETNLYQVDYTCDAVEEEIETAVAFLRQAILALRDMIANLTEEEITYADQDACKETSLREAHEEAKDTTKPCKVPSLLSPLQGKKPVCLISFGNVTDAHRHPPPDPLLLVLKAANNFGVMAGMKMLANGSNEDDDDDISERDIMAEEAFLEARERSLRPKTWSDLAIGLGQPNGYLASGLNETDS